MASKNERRARSNSLKFKRKLESRTSARGGYARTLKKRTRTRDRNVKGK